MGASAAPAVQPTLAAAAVEEQCGQALRFHASAGERTDGVEGDRQPPSPLLRMNGETRPLPLRASPRRVQVARAAETTLQVKHAGAMFYYTTCEPRARGVLLAPGYGLGYDRVMNNRVMPEGGVAPLHVVLAADLQSRTRTL